MLNISKKAAYGVLAMSIAFEIMGTALIKACDGFSIKWMTIALILCYFIAFCSFSKILHIIDLGIGYATWSAAGAIATALMGVTLFHQPLTPIGWISLLVMITGVFLLNLYGTPKEASEEDSATAQDVLEQPKGKDGVSA